MSDERIFKTALGIQTGDLVKTSYGTGPFEVWDISEPYNRIDRLDNTLAVFAYPMVSLVLVYPGDIGHAGYINNVRQVADGWATPDGDRIFVERPAAASALQLGLFQSHLPVPAPYQTRVGVDYEAGQRKVWHCNFCGLDFNAAPTARHYPPDCPFGCWQAPQPIELVGEDDWWCWATGKESVVIDGKRYAKIGGAI
jgi:hypothetical protein